MIRTLLTQGRKLDAGTPRTSALGADFGRFGFALIDVLKAQGAGGAKDLQQLDTLIDFRNAILHGNETEIADLILKGQIRDSKTVYRRYRRTLERLARTLDGVVAKQLSGLLRIAAPW